MGRRPKKASRKVLAIGAGILAEALALRVRGYPMGTNVIVRCRRGHLFSTIWLPGISFKSLRLIWWRGQRCPVGNHWTIVTPVRRGEISDAERQSALGRKDVRVP